MLPQPSIQPVREERRRYQRVKVHLLGRYMLPDRREYPCQVINMSPGGVAMLPRGSAMSAIAWSLISTISAGSKAKLRG